MGVKIVFGVCIALLLFCFVGVASASIIFVPDNYAKIQWAVDNASAGDTIIVRDGTYYENVNVNKRLTIRSENGSASTIVQAANPYDVFDVTADYVNINGFTVNGASWYAGIHINADYCNISNNNASNNYYGIRLEYSSNNTLTGNNASNNRYGIYLEYSSKNTLTGNNANSNNWRGIYLWDSSKNTLTGNNASNNWYGIYLGSSNNNMLTGNNASNNWRGIYLEYSSNNMLMNNNASNNYYGYGIYLGSSNNNMLTSNNESNNYYGIYLYSSNNNMLTNNNANSNYWYGIRLDGSSNNTLTGNNASNNYIGIYLFSSNNNTLTNNTMSGNKYNFGIGGWTLSHFEHNIDTSNEVNGKPIYYLVNERDKEIPEDAGFVGIINSTNITVRDLTLTNNYQGVLLAYTSNSRIENVKASNNYYGIYLWGSSKNTLTGNNANSNNHCGIYLWGSSKNTLTGNNANSNNHCGIYLWGSSKNTLTGNNESNNRYGIYLEYSSKNTLTGNNESNNYIGIYLFSSNNNMLTSNNESNNYYGIYLWYSSNNKIYLNNFINNTDNVYSYNSANIWNSTSPMTYTYNGQTFTNYLGNYWSDYKGSDADGDGIGDTPYSIDSDKDNYPLMERFENYFAPTENVFDTGAPSNPYPSISGTHNGTITPNKTIIATKLYTYPCPGTGGHTEYARIWNETWNATAYWNGYVGDWHNISFDKTVVLMANETYFYEIRTGSYPQIHHTDTLPTANGWINCTSFTDANGRVYHDWIPAIKLF